MSPTPTATPSADSAAGQYNWGTPTAGDEFNYVGAPDPTKWSVYNGAGHAGNGTRNPANVTVNGAALDIVGKPDGSAGGISSRFDRGTTTSGRWEVRARAYGADPTGYRHSGYHTVLMVWPDAGKSTANGCQEIDYSEGTGTVTVVHSYIHYGCPTVQATATKTLDQREWHNYALEWNASHLTTYIDGAVFYTTTNTAIAPDAASHSTIQLDNFLGDLGESHLQVDYERFWTYAR